MMKEVKFYKYTTIALIALNFLIIAFFIFNKPNHPRPGQQDDLKKHAVQLLSLDEGQKKEFYQLVELHQREMESLNELQRQNLELVFESISNDKSSPNQETKLSELNKIEMRKIELTLAHFESIKDILRPEQLDDFNQFVKRATNQILGHGGKRNQGPPPPPNR